MNYIRLLLILFGLNLYSFNSIAANIDIRTASTAGTCRGAQIQINGEIAKGDSKVFTEIVNKVQAEYCQGASPIFTFVHISSNGGDINESMAIGRLIRKYQLITTVPANAKCLSSCVFIVVGGIGRHVFGSVGIHRPYLAATTQPLSSDQIRILRELINNNIINYLKEMDISPQLLEDMLAIEPERIKILTSQEVSKYRIDVEDANLDEERVSRSAFVYGITNSDYRKRFQEALLECKKYINESAEKNSICFHAIVLKISEMEANRRGSAARNCDILKNIDAVLNCKRRAFLE